MNAFVCAVFGGTDSQPSFGEPPARVAGMSRKPEAEWSASGKVASKARSAARHVIFEKVQGKERNYEWPESLELVKGPGGFPKKQGQSFEPLPHAQIGAPTATRRPGRMGSGHTH